MILTITIVLSSLIAVNFLLFTISNFKVKKARKAIENKTPRVLQPTITNEEPQIQLAPTGS